MPDAWGSMYVLEFTVEGLGLGEGTFASGDASVCGGYYQHPKLRILSGVLAERVLKKGLGFRVITTPPP